MLEFVSVGYHTNLGAQGNTMIKEQEALETREESIRRLRDEERVWDTYMKII